MERLLDLGALPGQAVSERLETRSGKYPDFGETHL